MLRWTGRVAVVTGTSAGIGAAIAYQLQDHGVNVVALARRADKVEEAVKRAREDAKKRGRYQETQTPAGKLYAKQCDLCKEEDIVGVFKWVRENLGGIDILVNNAAIGGDSKLTEGKTEDWKRLLDTNVIGLSICTREAVQDMRSRGVDDGHILHIGSVVGHVMPPHSMTAMYSASKHAVRALTEGLRKDFLEHKNKIKVSSITPGFVKTEFILSLPTLKNMAEVIYEKNPHLFPEDIADAVIFAISTPPHVQIHEVIVKPIGENM